MHVVFIMFYKRLSVCFIESPYVFPLSGEKVLSKRNISWLNPLPFSNSLCLHFPSIFSICIYTWRFSIKCISSFSHSILLDAMTQSVLFLDFSRRSAGNFGLSVISSRWQVCLVDIMTIAGITRIVTTPTTIRSHRLISPKEKPSGFVSISAEDMRAPFSLLDPRPHK